MKKKTKNKRGFRTNAKNDKIHYLHCNDQLNDKITFAFGRIILIIK